MVKVEREFLGRTFDDFLFRPHRGIVESRKKVTLDSRLSRRLKLALPIISANMDSVTEAEMARTLALEGGIGIIHRALPIDVQAQKVRDVKRSQGYVIEEPFCLPRAATIREARRFTHTHKVTGVLVESEKGSRILAGLLSNRDIPWLGDFDDRPIEDFMTPLERLITAPPDIPVEDAERLMFENRIEKLPLIEEDGRIQGLITKKDLILFRQRPFSSKDSKGRLLVGAAIGARGDFLERAAELIKAGADVLVIDIAHGHSEVMEDAITRFRKRFADAELICGNVGTAEGALFLQQLGADAVKVGIGPGRGCRTRLETGAGVPQLQAIRESWLALKDEIPIIADGGIKDDKDLFLALACGASSVMLGSMLSGTDEAPGHVITDPATGSKQKIYRGMTSPQAVLHALYNPEDSDSEADEMLDTPPEGQEMQVPYRGSVVSILQRMRGHLSSAVSYAGAATLEEARQRILSDPLHFFIPLSQASIKESYER